MTTFAIQKELTRPSSRSLEYQLILLCARCQPDIRLLNDLLDRATALIDWEEVIKASSMHNVLPLVYRALSELASDRVPKTVLSRLMKLYLINCAHSQRLAGAAQNLVEIFAHHHIPIIVFKGPVLAKEVYGSIHFRKFSDIDLLIHEEDVSKARQLLIREGFQPRLLTDDCSPSDYLASRIWDDSFIHPETQVMLDLHWQLMPDYFPIQFDLKQIWSNRHPVQLEQGLVESINPEEMLLYLCAHGSKELWRRLIWICDVAEFVRTYPNLPWLKLSERSRQLGIERMFLLGLTLAADLLDAPIPELLKDDIQQPIIQDLSTEFKRRIFCSIETTIESAEHGFWLFHNPLHLKMRDRWRDRLPQYWLTFKFLVTPNQEDREFLKLPPQIDLLYFLIRPLRIGLKWSTARRSTDFRQSS